MNVVTLYKKNITASGVIELLHMLILGWKPRARRMRRIGAQLINHFVTNI